MCEHKQFKTVSEVKATDVAGVFAVKLFSTCAQCGSPLRFAEDGKVQTQNRGLVGIILAAMAGD